MLKTENSIDPKSQLSTILLKPRELTERMTETLEDYMLSLYGVSEDSKRIYLGQLKTFTSFLMSRGIKRFQDATSKDMDLFLSHYQKDNTKNAYIARIKYLYVKLLKQPELVEHLKIVNHDIEPVTPAARAHKLTLAELNLIYFLKKVRFLRKILFF